MGTARQTRRRKPKLAVFKFASCDGCQLSLLDLEDHLLDIAEAVDIVSFREATSRDSSGPFDIALADGSITTAHDAQRIRDLRSRTKVLVAIGACATAGGVQALRNYADVQAFRAQVYPKPEIIKTLATSTAFSDHVPVDFELRGCPIDKRQLLELITALLAGRKPGFPDHSVCVECKLNGLVCVMVTGTPCLGPVTHGGCGALCPAHQRGCYGCFGAKEAPNTAALSRALLGSGVAKTDVVRLYRNFNANAPAFRAASEAHED